MPDAVIHPTPQELTAFGLGKLPEGAAAVVATHLESCAACRQAVAGVSADSFLNKVRDAKQDKTLLPPSLAHPQIAPSSADRPAMPIVPCPNIPPELANHPKYLIRRELGQGGMGVVYQGWHKEMNRQIVIKVINRALLDKPEALERFRREIQAAAQLSHPNIVTAHDAEQASELHMLVMEFVPGQDLGEVLEKKGPLSVRHACHYMRQVAWGLQHAYERGMVHRDIKPQNLIRTPKGQIKILDFGLAKIASEHDTSKGITASGDYMGTPEYSSPEQAEDASKADIRADLYSLGCTLYCLLAGYPPFREDTRMKTILAHRDKAPQPLTELRQDVPERLWRVVARLLAKNPAQRYQKPIEVVQALAPFVKTGATPPPAVNSPVKGTKIGADTNQIKKILQEVPGKTPPKQEPAKEEAASPSADLTGTGAASKDVVRLSARVKSYLAVWWIRIKVIAVAVIVSLALIGTAVIISKFKEQFANDKTNKRSAPNRGTGKFKPSSVNTPDPGPPNPPNLDEPPEEKNNIEGNNPRPKVGPGKQDDAQECCKRGRALLDKGDVDGAIVEFRRAIQLNKNHHEAHCNLGNALSRKGNFEEAISECRRAIELKKDGKDCPVAHYNLGYALSAKCDWEGAIAAYRQAITLKPDYTDAYCNLGVALARQEKYMEAEAACRKAIELKPGFADAYVNLGVALVGQKKYVEAEAAYRKAIALKPDFAEAYNGLGLALRSQGKRAEAEAKGPSKDAGFKPPVNFPADASVDDLRQALKDKNPDMRKQAATILGKRGSAAEAALNDLADTLANEKDSEARAAEALAIAKTAAEIGDKIGDKAKAVVTVLASGLQRDQGLEIRQAAALALRQIKYPANKEAVPGILDAIENDKDAGVRANCVMALNNMPNQEFKNWGADKLLTKVLDERAKNMEVVRYNAACKLAHTLQAEAPDKTVDVLLQLLKDKDAKFLNGGDARPWAAILLALLGDKAAKRPDVAEAIRKAAKDTDEKLKEEAQKAMKALNIKE